MAPNSAPGRPRARQKRRPRGAFSFYGLAPKLPPSWPKVTPRGTQKAPSEAQETAKTLQGKPRTPVENQDCKNMKMKLSRTRELDFDGPGGQSERPNGVQVALGGQFGGPSSVQKASKLAPSSPKLAPRACKLAPTAPKIAPRAPKIAQIATKLAPSWPQERPSCK